MAFMNLNFGEIKDRAKDLANTGVAQSKKLAEIAKLKTANMAEEDNMKRAYVELGKAYYQEHGTQPSDDMASVCEKITAARAAIEVNNQRIAELKGGDEDEAEDYAQDDIVAEVEADEVVDVETETEAETEV